MTEQQGLFTIQTWLSLTPEDRRRLEWLVREQGSDLADTATRIIADWPLDRLPAVKARPAGEPVPLRVYLSAEQRTAFDQYVNQLKMPLPELLSQIVAEHLAGVSTPPAASDPQSAQPDGNLRRQRAELARLRVRRDAAGATAPAWLNSYIADLEAEIARGA
jgi:hypothetical protein